MLLPMIHWAVADLLSGVDEDGLTPQERAKIDRTMARCGRWEQGRGR